MTTSYISSLALQNYCVDKNNGYPLSGGYMLCFQDTDRTVGKVVFQKVPFNPPQFDNAGNQIYDFVSLGDVITFSAVGTFVDNNNNDIQVYFYPYDSNGNLQLYYLEVFNSLGVMQFTREGYPDTFETENPGADTGDNTDNLISNPQFALVNFAPATSTTISLTGSGASTVALAPDWNLVISYAGTASVVVTQNAIAGSMNFPTNPPYSLTVAPTGAVTGLTLVQTLQSNGGIFANGYVGTNVVLGPGAPQIEISLNPSTGNPIELLTASNTASGITAMYSATVLLGASINTTAPPTGNATIQIALNTALSTTLTSIQVVALNGNTSPVPYIQETVNRQVDHLFNYYKGLLDFKPVSSYLVGWDFPYNPAQFLGTEVTQIASGANTSNYFWDQLIVFQSANSGIYANNAADGALLLSANVTSQLAMVQYLDNYTVNEMLAGYMSCNLRAFTNQSGGIPCTISLWYTTGTLPSVAPSTYKSIVATLNTDGSVLTTNAGSQPWVQVARSNLGNASFTLKSGTTYADYGWTDWLDTTGGSLTATRFAIVIGFGSLASGNSITIQSASCVPGRIATRPAPLSESQHLLNSQRYYWKTFPQGTIPATGTGSVGAITYTAQIASTTAGYTVQLGLPAVLRTAPTVTYYNPINANAKWYNAGASADSGVAATFPSGSTNGLSIKNPQASGDAVGNAIFVHASLDARLGVV